MIPSKDIAKLLYDTPLSENELLEKSGLPLQELREELGILCNCGFIDHVNKLIWLTSEGEKFARGERVDFSKIPGLKDLVGLAWKQQKKKPMVMNSVVLPNTIEEARALIEQRETEGIEPTVETCWVCLQGIHHGGDVITVNGKQRRKHKRCKP